MSKANEVRVRKSQLVSIKQGRLEDFYTLLERIGEGSYGSVHKAVDLVTNDIVAIKSIRKPRDPNNLVEVIEEINILKNLEHPNIIRILEIIEDDMRFHIITELCTGGELFQRILTSTSITEKDAAIYMKQVIKAVFYCHNAGIVHKDLKPENLVFESEDQEILKLIDFGNSRKNEFQTKRNRISGSVSHI